ncbi:pre-rRNA processing protein [Polyrhizophydium stewartii]|uniref:Pre-rRNA processing protein n=1 Tax=Polyrhizophydium stewartii TaxID=2732419 RepID=A0ABR4NKT3_9FUNG|nr:hypothetical protein HK105_006895 [Polyrhizophydium stewartii]
MADISSIFNRVRSQTGSGLENQRQVAVLLTAVEQTIVEQGEQLVPLAYFGALMTVVEQQQKAAADDGMGTDSTAMLAAATYLLAMVFPRIPAAVLRFKFQQVAEVFVGLLDLHDDHAPLVRSVISCLEHVLIAQDSSAWSSNETCKRASEMLLLLTIDDRPKVRKAAGDAVRRIIKTPPPPAMHHPATSRAVDFCTQLLSEFLAASSANGGAPASRTDAEEKVLFAFVFIKAVIPVFAAQARNDRIRQKLDKLCAALLAIPVRSSSVGNTVLTQWVFQIFEALLSGEGDAADAPSLEPEMLRSVVKRLLELSPYENDAALTPAWLNIMADAFQRLSESVCEFELQHTSDDAELADAAMLEFTTLEYPELVASLFDRIFATFFNGSAVKPVILQRAVVLLSVLGNQAVSNSMVAKAASGDAQSDLLAMTATLNKALSNILCRDTWGYILLTASALIERLGRQAPQLVVDTVRCLFAFRDDPAYGSSFPYKDELSRATNSTVQALGMADFVAILPLNIENEFPKQPRRPYLLATFNEALQQPLPPSQWTPTRVVGSHTLQFFLEQLMPLGTRCLERAGRMWADGKELEAKLHETLGIQIFDLFPLVCASIPADTQSQFGKLAPQLGKLLQTLPAEAFPNLPSSHDLRPIVCEGLRNLIETHYELAQLGGDDSDDSEDDDEAGEASAVWRSETAAKARAALARISTYVNRFLSVLCNNYTTVDAELVQASKAKGQTLQMLHERAIQHYEKTIRAFLLIADKSAVSDYFLNMVQTLLQKQTELQRDAEMHADTAGGPSGPSVFEIERLRMYTILDLVLILTPFLPNDDNEQSQPESPLQLLYQVLLGQLAEPDATLQKKTYKALHQVLQVLPVDAIDQKDLFARILDEEAVTRATSGTKRSRMRLIQHLCETIDDTQLLMQAVPEAIPEIILATKEASEKSRDAAYDCLVSIGHQIIRHATEGTVSSLDTLGSALRRGLNDKSDDDDEDMTTFGDEAQHKAEVSIREYLLMVVAGLAGTTAHMQSASIAALGRLLFEFSEILEAKLVGDLIKTVLISMQSRNREVIKAALGFIKVAIVCLPQEILEEDLETIIVSILEHSRDHKSHFKAKVRHILERIIRKFSFEAVEGFIPESDKKLINNIRKRRERLKKQKAQARPKPGAGGDADGDGEIDPNEDPAAAARRSLRLAKSRGFDEALHGSESELETDSEDDEAYIPEQFRDETRKIRNSGTLIREGGEDDIVDFLDTGVVSKVAAARGGARKDGKAARGSARAGAAADGKAVKFATNDSGRLIVGDSESDADGADQDADGGAMQEDYYKHSLQSETAFTRTQDGRIKFIAKRKRGPDDDDDGAAGEGGEDGGSRTVGSRWSGGRNVRKAKKPALDMAQVNRMLGRQYKAKNARGDVKKPGQADPHAYIPLRSHVVGNMHKSTRLDDSFKTILKAAQRGGDASMGKAKGKAAPKAFTRSKANKRHK